MLAVGQEFDQTAVGLPGIHLVSNHLKALPQLPTAQMLLLCSSLQFLAARGSAAQVSSVCTLFLTVLNILPILHPTVSRMWKMNGGNKQRKLAEHFQIPAAYLLIGLHLLKNFGQLASS